MSTLRSLSVESVLYHVRRASRVDMKKLEKQEAKLKVRLCILRDPQNIILSMFSGQDREAVSQGLIRGFETPRST